MDDPEEYYFADDIPSTMDYDEPMMYDYGPNGQGVLTFDDIKPRAKRDYSEQKRQTAKLRNYLDDGTIQRVTNSLQSIKPGQLGIILRRTKKNAKVLRQLPVNVQLEQIGQSTLKEDSDVKLREVRNDPAALYTAFSGLKLETGVRQERGDFDMKKKKKKSKRVIGNKLGKYEIRRPGYDLKHFQGVRHEVIKESEEYRRELEAAQVNMMQRQAYWDKRLYDMEMEAIALAQKQLPKTTFEEPPEDYTGTCARIRPVKKLCNRQIIDRDLLKNQVWPEFNVVDRYTLDYDLNHEMIGLIELQRRAFVAPSYQSVSENIRSMQRQQAGLETAKPKSFLSAKNKKDKLSKLDDAPVAAEEIKMVIKRLVPHKTVGPKTPIGPTQYQISKKSAIQHPPSEPIIPKKRPPKKVTQIKKSAQ